MVIWAIFSIPLDTDEKKSTKGKFRRSNAQCKEKRAIFLIGLYYLVLINVSFYEVLLGISSDKQTTFVDWIFDENQKDTKEMKKNVYTCLATVDACACETFPYFVLVLALALSHQIHC